MKKIILAAVAMTISFSAMAKNQEICDYHPANERYGMTQLKTDLEKDGWHVAKLDYDNNCYEVKAYNKDGMRLKGYYDTKTGKAVDKIELKRQKCQGDKCGKKGKKMRQEKRQKRISDPQ